MTLGSGLLIMVRIRMLHTSVASKLGVLTILEPLPIPLSHLSLTTERLCESIDPSAPALGPMF